MYTNFDQFTPGIVQESIEALRTSKRVPLPEVLAPKSWGERINVSDKKLETATHVALQRFQEEEEQVVLFFPRQTLRMRLENGLLSYPTIGGNRISFFDHDCPMEQTITEAIQTCYFTRLRKPTDYSSIANRVHLVYFGKFKSYKRKHSEFWISEPKDAKHILISINLDRLKVSEIDPRIIVLHKFSISRFDTCLFLVIPLELTPFIRNIEDDAEAVVIGARKYDRKRDLDYQTLFEEALILDNCDYLYAKHRAERSTANREAAITELKEKCGDKINNFTFYDHYFSYHTEWTYHLKHYHYLRPDLDDIEKRIQDNTDDD